MKLPLIALILFGLLYSCNSPKETKFQSSQAQSLQDTTQTIYEVATQSAIVGNFPLKVITTGILSASQQLQLKLPSSGFISHFTLEVGQTIQKGQLIAQLDDIELQHQLRQKQLDLEKAIFEKNDMLVLQGGKESDDSSVPPHKLKNILTLSGYNRAILAIEQTERAIEQMKIYAPFGGIISEINLQIGQQVSAGAPICTIINHQTFEAVFNLTEEEALQISKGERVKVSLIAQSSRTFTAQISTIRPVVSKDGLVEIRAKLMSKNTSKLLEGMNLNIVLEKPVPNQVIVPKSSIVLRSGREVIFTYDENSGLAKWNYVTVLHQNDEQATIAKGIVNNDKVIVKGQLNLAHDAEVKIIN